MSKSFKIGSLVALILIVITIIMPSYNYVRMHHESGKILVSRDAGHSFIGSSPQIPSDGTSYYGTPTYQGHYTSEWSTRIDYARMGIYSALSVVIGVICGLLVNLRLPKKTPIDQYPDETVTEKRPASYSETAASSTPPIATNAQGTQKVVTHPKVSSSQFRSNSFFRYSIATVCAFVGMIAGAVAIEVAAESGTRLPVFTPAALALGGFFFVTKIILPAPK